MFLRTGPAPTVGVVDLPGQARPWTGLTAGHGLRDCADAQVKRCGRHEQCGQTKACPARLPGKACTVHSSFHFEQSLSWHAWRGDISWCDNRKKMEYGSTPTPAGNKEKKTSSAPADNQSQRNLRPINTFRVTFVHVTPWRRGAWNSFTFLPLQRFPSYPAPPASSHVSQFHQQRRSTTLSALTCMQNSRVTERLGISSRREKNEIVWAD